jgi:hypothetical protein
VRVEMSLVETSVWRATEPCMCRNGLPECLTSDGLAMPARLRHEAGSDSLTRPGI